MQDISEKQSVTPQPNHHLSHKETRQIVTPYAFHVSPELFGTPLAKPRKRAFAIAVDMLLVAIIAQAASFLLAGVAAITFFRAGNRLKLKKRFNAARLAMRFVAAMLLFVFAWGLFGEMDLDGFNDDGHSDITKGVNVGGMTAVAVVGLTTKYMIEASSLQEEVADGTCSPAVDCWQALGDEFAHKLAAVLPNPAEFANILGDFSDIAQEQLSEEQHQVLNKRWQQILNKQSSASEQSNADEGTEQHEPETNIAPPATTQGKTKYLADLTDDSDDKPQNSIVAWVKSILEDLGLGFGWAAFYFSLFTGWWRGQTPGKKLMGIKVIKLDGSAPNLWESFGRYGGYGAGLATGLLGFLQVYWDPNRQAIQDKISETLVIDIRKPKVHFVLETNENQGAEGYNVKSY